jgi:hypothetical protein
MSFLEALKVHEYLDELFLQHQESLLQLDIELDTERLMSYEHELRRHKPSINAQTIPDYAAVARARAFGGLHPLQSAQSDATRGLGQIENNEFRFSRMLRACLAEAHVASYIDSYENN